MGRQQRCIEIELIGANRDPGEEEPGILLHENLFNSDSMEGVADKSKSLSQPTCRGFLRTIPYAAAL